jgi:bacillithiol biosynthesis deacetylase BshB1
MIDVLCIGAHPDDVEIGMGASIVSFLKQGLRVAIIDLTDGEPTPFGTHELRLAEARASADALGVAERRTLDLPNRWLEATIPTRRLLAEQIRELKPRVIFAPYPVDAHPDHVAASALCDAARFAAKLVKGDLRGTPHWTPRLWHYAAVHLRLHVAPAFILDVGDALPAKMRALRCYESQFVANEANAELLTNIERQAWYWGGLIRCAAGEPFFAREAIGLSSITPLL